MARTTWEGADDLLVHEYAIIEPLVARHLCGSRQRLLGGVSSVLRRLAWILCSFWPLFQSLVWKAHRALSLTSPPPSGAALTGWAMATSEEIRLRGRG